jgi:S-adenosylmethionine-diacylgycerolhomoserine-N-methlytransferase
VSLDERPYGTHNEYAGAVDRILFSNSLSMMPPFGAVLESARADLRPGGRIAVVDFLDARRPVDRALERSHVFLGEARLRRLQELFPDHRLAVRRAGAWRYYVFAGTRE